MPPCNHSAKTVPGTVLGTSYRLTHFLLPTTPVLQVKELKHQEIKLLVKDHTLARGKAGISLRAPSRRPQAHAHSHCAPWSLEPFDMAQRPLLGPSNLAVLVRELSDSRPCGNPLLASHCTGIGEFISVPLPPAPYLLATPASFRILGCSKLSPTF